MAACGHYTIAASKVKRQKAYETPLWYHHEIGGIIAALRLLYHVGYEDSTMLAGSATQKQSAA